MAKKHTNIGELRSSLALVVKMLANKGIKVTQVGIQAFVEYDERTLEAKRVNIPSISDQSPPELVTAIKGFVDHEVAHLLFTDAKIIERAHKERIANLHNIVEDTFIERKMKNAFAGSTRNIDKTLEFAIKHFFQRSFDKHIKGYDTEADDSSQARFFVRALATPGIRALSGQEAAQEFMADKWELIPEVYEGLAPLAESLESINSSLQSLKLANTIREILADVETNERKAKKEKAKKADPMEKPSKPSESDDGEEGDEGDDALVLLLVNRSLKNQKATPATVFLMSLRKRARKSLRSPTVVIVKNPPRSPTILAAVGLQVILTMSLKKVKTMVTRTANLIPKRKATRKLMRQAQVQAATVMKKAKQKTPSLMAMMTLRVSLTMTIAIGAHSMMKMAMMTTTSKVMMTKTKAATRNPPRINTSAPTALPTHARLCYQ
ncbi:hypothetical protein HSBAA_31000 [Vreelandella sulfidaeris]|uniref:Uncharacterized protein n=1 Tax=Vreelandella sulfidaeris TaxID=115553 RepID=A0A455UF80_9GAMM|nr:hypothetical protein HSBAA_31000 [Halomonas sulfidaeris]